MNAITPFNFEDHEVRVRDQDGQPWFVAADVCAALGIVNSRDAIARLDDDEKGVVSTDTLGGSQVLSVINESGLYTVILRCRDAMRAGTAPHRFRKWVTSEVLPSIRTAGQYGAPAPLALDDPATLRAALLGYTEQVIALEAANVELEHQIEEIAPKAAIYDKYLNADGLMSLQDLGRALGQGPNKFIERLKGKWLFESRGTLIPHSRFADAGIKIFTVKSRMYGEKLRRQTMATPKAIPYFAKKLGTQPSGTAH